MAPPAGEIGRVASGRNVFLLCSARGDCAGSRKIDKGRCKLMEFSSDGC